MKMQPTNKIQWFGWLIVFALSCSLPNEPGPQPTILVDTGTESLVNVFGVLRPDSGKSFIQVDVSYSLETADNTEPEPIPLGEVMVIDSVYSDTSYFLVDPDDSTNHYFTLTNFCALTGHTYLVTIDIPGYPQVTGSTTVPPVPGVVIAHTSNPGYFQVTFAPHSGLHSFDLNLVLVDGDDSEQTKLRKTSKATGADELTVEFEWSDISKLPQHLVIYGYERNLGEYLGTIVSVKPQSYQPLNYYVNGGFGVIGALNFTDEYLIK